MKLLLYLLQVAACTGVFYLFYFLVLRRLTFFSLNRWYLLGTLLLSFAVPLVTLPAGAVLPAKVPAAGVVAAAADFSDSFKVPEVLQTQEISAAPASTAAVPEKMVIPYEELLLWLYLLVAAVFAFRLLRSLVLLLVRLRAAEVVEGDDFRLVRGSRHFSTGSFFGFVFLEEEGLAAGEVEQVLAHEAVHVRQLHSLDKLLAELVQVVLWFNPFAYAYTRAIELNHEFEVDAQVAAQHDKRNYAELLLRLAACKPQLYHQFQASPLHARVKMLYYKPSSTMKKLAYLFAMPLVVAALFAFAGRKVDVIQVSLNDQVSDINVLLPEESKEIIPEETYAIIERVSVPEVKSKALEGRVDQTPIASFGPQQADALKDYNQINKIKVGQTSKEEILRIFGSPSPEPATVIGSDQYWYEWHLQTTPPVFGSPKLSVRFYKDNKVADYHYSSMKKPDTIPVLTEERVRLIKMKSSTVEEVIRTFGQPSNVFLNPRLISFYYKNDPYTTLTLSFIKSRPTVVSSINFSTQSNVPIEIDTTKIPAIKKAQTSPEEVLKLFGKPNGKKIGDYGERWIYISKEYELLIDFRFKENSDELYLDDFRHSKLYKFSKVVNPK